MTRISRRTGAGIYYLSDASGSDQLWRVALPRRHARAGHRLRHRHRRLSAAPSGDRIAIWADRDMACADINCAGPAAAPAGAAAAGSTTRPSSATGIPGRARPALAHLHLRAGRRPAAGRGHAGRAAPDRRFAVQAVRRRRGARLEPRRPHPLFHPARGGPARAQFDQSRHLRGPRRRQRARRSTSPPPTRAWTPCPPSRPTAAGSLMRRWRAPTYEADRQVVQLRNLATGETRALTQAWDRSVGSIAWAPDGRSLLVTAERHARRPGLPRRHRAPAGRPG